MPRLAEGTRGDARGADPRASPSGAPRPPDRPRRGARRGGRRARCLGHLRAVDRGQGALGLLHAARSAPRARPGDIIRTEPLDDLPEGVQGWRVLYRSTGMDGEPIAVSGGIFAPSGDAPAGGRPVVAWAHGTSGIVPACAPSIDDADGGLFARIPSTADLVGAGYVVTATDYPGLGTPGLHPYLVGHERGLGCARQRARPRSGCRRRAPASRSRSGATPRGVTRRCSRVSWHRTTRPSSTSSGSRQRLRRQSWPSCSSATSTAPRASC